MTSATALVDVFVERGAPTSGTSPSGLPDSPVMGPCLSLHGVQWQGSLLGRDKRRVICRFRAPDAESVRQALLRAEVRYDRLWTGQVREESGSGAVNLVIGFQFEKPRNALQAGSLFLQTAKRLKRHRIQAVRSAWSLCQRRGLLLCHADAGAAIASAWDELAAEGMEYWSCSEVMARPATVVFSAPDRRPALARWPA